MRNGLLDTHTQPMCHALADFLVQRDGNLDVPAGFNIRFGLIQIKQCPSGVEFGPPVAWVSQSNHSVQLRGGLGITFQFGFTGFLVEHGLGHVLWGNIAPQKAKGASVRESGSQNETSSCSSHAFHDTTLNPGPCHQRLQGGEEKPREARG